jgi:hypothetical protein
MLGDETAAEIRIIEAAKVVIREHDRAGSTSASRRQAIIGLREALELLKGLEKNGT